MANLNENKALQRIGDPWPYVSPSGRRRDGWIGTYAIASPRNLPTVDQWWPLDDVRYQIVGVRIVWSDEKPEGISVGLHETLLDLVLRPEATS